MGVENKGRFLDYESGVADIALRQAGIGFGTWCDGARVRVRRGIGIHRGELRTKTVLTVGTVGEVEIGRMTMNSDGLRRGPVF